ncbi:hypothetical protein R6Q57_001691 [Mikania cordata]
MSFWDESFFNYSVPDLNEEPPIEYSYGTIDLNAEPNAYVVLTVKHRMGSCMMTVNKVTRRRLMKKSRRLQTLTGKPKSLYFITDMDAEMPHQDDFVQQGLPLDPDTLALSQHEWLRFEPASAAAIRCRRILRMSMGTPHYIDWGVLADCGEAERARAILGEDTPWTRLFELVELPTYRLITVEFLSTFRYRALQAVVRAEEDAELPPDIEFSLGGQHFEMSIERFAVHLGIYYEPESVLDDFGQGLTQGEEGVMRAWWAQISETPFTGHRVRATMIRDPLIRYINHCIVTTISGRGQSQEWVTTTDLFYLHSLIAGRSCNLALCFA